MLIIGAHRSISKGFFSAVEDAVENLNCNALQLFLKSPQSLSFCKISKEDAEKTKNYVLKHNIFVVGHCSYLLNFAKNQELKESDVINGMGVERKIGNWAVNSLLDDVLSLEKIGGYGIVLHTGKYGPLDKKETPENIELKRKNGIKMIAENIKKAINDLDYKEQQHNIKYPYIVIENTAGQGTEIGRNLEEIKEIWDLLDHSKRVKFCLDTAHSYASGYDIKTEKGFKDFIEKFDKYIGLQNLGLFHFNDCKKDLGSCVDRHDSIGHGFIGEAGLKNIAKFAKEHNIPIIVETPDKEISHLQDINLIKSWF